MATTKPELLDIAAVAARLGVRVETITRYRHRDPTFPDPDVTLGGHPGWLPETIDAWIAARPGRTGRPRKEAATPTRPQKGNRVS